MHLINWADYQEIPHFLRDDNDAYSLPIAVRVEKNTDYSEEDAFIAVSKAIVSMFNSDKWQVSVENWMKGRIRKVVRKARGVAWDKLFALDHIYVKHNNVEVLIFEPYRLDSVVPNEIKKLQVQGIDFISSKPTVSSGFRLAISVNPEIKMSSGKAMAQIGHGAQIAILKSSPTVLEKWLNDGCKVSIEPWDTLPDNSFQIFDAGLTEIPAGSLTVKSAFLD